MPNIEYRNNPKYLNTQNSSFDIKYSVFRYCLDIRHSTLDIDEGSL